jgi:hypothetical protein
LIEDRLIEALKEIQAKSKDFAWQVFLLSISQSEAIW